MRRQMKFLMCAARKILIGFLLGLALAVGLLAQNRGLEQYSSMRGPQYRDIIGQPEQKLHIEVTHTFPRSVVMLRVWTRTLGGSLPVTYWGSQDIGKAVHAFCRSSGAWPKEQDAAMGVLLASRLTGQFSAIEFKLLAVVRQSDEDGAQRSSSASDSVSRDEVARDGTTSGASDTPSPAPGFESAPAPLPLDPLPLDVVTHPKLKKPSRGRGWRGRIAYRSKSQQRGADSFRITHKQGFSRVDMAYFRGVSMRWSVAMTASVTIELDRAITPIQEWQVREVLRQYFWEHGPMHFHRSVARRSASQNAKRSKQRVSLGRSYLAKQLRPFLPHGLQPRLTGLTVESAKEEAGRRDAEAEGRALARRHGFTNRYY